VTPEADARRERRLLAALIAVVLLVIPTAMLSAWLMAETFWWLVEHKGWARAFVGAAVATGGILYVLHNRRHP
jgi:hypothetical protein